MVREKWIYPKLRGFFNMKKQKIDNLHKTVIYYIYLEFKRSVGYRRKQMKKINPKIKEETKKLKGMSCWLVNNENGLKRLSFTKPTKENVRFLIECYDCIALYERDPEIHVYRIRDLVEDEEGDYLLFCPNVGSPINWISRKRCPKQIKKLIR